MKHEKIIKREDGTSYLIDVSIRITSYDLLWDISVCTREKGKKKWLSVVDSNCYLYRSLSMGEREKYRLSRYLKHVTAEEIFAAKTELWEKLRPTL